MNEEDEWTNRQIIELVILFFVSMIVLFVVFSFISKLMPEVYGASFRTIIAGIAAVLSLYHVTLYSNLRFNRNAMLPIDKELVKDWRNSLFLYMIIIAALIAVLCIGMIIDLCFSKTGADITCLLIVCAVALLFLIPGSVIIRKIRLHTNDA